MSSGEPMAAVEPEFDPAVMAALADYTAQLPDFIEKLKAVFTNMMKHLSAYPGSLPYFESPAVPDGAVTQEVLKCVVWRFSEGSLFGLSDLVRHLRSVIPASFNEALPLSDQAIKDMVLSACERKAYGFEVPKAGIERQEAPPHPALLVWEVDLKLTPSEAVPVEWRMALERGRKDRREIHRKQTALEKLVRALQAVSLCPQRPHDLKAALDRVTRLREAWRVEEKKEERERLVEEERERRRLEAEAKAEAVRLAKADAARVKESKKLDDQVSKERRKLEEAAMKVNDPIKSVAKMTSSAEKSSTSPKQMKPAPKADKPKVTLLNFFQKQPKSTTPPAAEPVQAEASEAAMELSAPAIEEDLKARWRAKPRPRRTRRRLVKVIDGMRLSAPIPDMRSVKLPGLVSAAGVDEETAQARNFRLIYMNIHDRTRPPFKAVVADGAWTFDRGLRLQGSRELAELFDYDVDTDEEWDELNNAEDLDQELDEDEEELEDDADDDKDSFVVSDGHFSDDDDLSEDEQAMIKQQTTTAQASRPGIDPVIIDHSTEIPAAEKNKWAHAFFAGDLDIQVYSAENFFTVVQVNNAPTTSSSAKKSEIWTSDFRRTLALFVHGKAMALDDIVRDFETEHPKAKDAGGLRRVFKELFKFEKRSNAKRSAWVLLDEKAAELEVTAETLNQLVLERANQVGPKKKKEEYPSVALYARI